MFWFYDDVYFFFPVISYPGSRRTPIFTYYDTLKDRLLMVFYLNIFLKTKMTEYPKVLRMT